MHGSGEMAPADRKRRRRRRLLIWLSIDGVVAIVLIALLLYRPAGYKPQRFGMAADPNEMDRYWTYLSREFYNGAQTRRPFELVVVEEHVNKALAQSNWPKSSGEVLLYVPQATFSPEGITVMGMANLKGAELVLTGRINPTLTKEGLLSISVETFKVGALAVTPLAKMVAGQMYAKRLEEGPVDRQDIRGKIAGAVFAEKPFDPILNVDKAWVRLDRISLDKGRLILRFVPARGQP